MYILVSPSWTITRNRLLEDFFPKKIYSLRRIYFVYKHKVSLNKKCIKERNYRVRELLLVSESFHILDQISFGDYLICD